MCKKYGVDALRLLALLSIDWKQGETASLALIHCDM